MSIETALGTGTAVSLFVPQIESEIAGNRIDETEVSETQIEANETQIEVNRILVVEDSPGLRALVCRMLRSSGYKVLAAEDGELAMSIASNEPDIDLVISDIMLPGAMSGWDVCRDLSKQKNDMRFLLMTGYSDKEQDDIDVPILYKPFRKEELLSRVRRILS
jgi:DNA-binding response OmpR family regulator